MQVCVTPYVLISTTIPTAEVCDVRHMKRRLMRWLAVEVEKGAINTVDSVLWCCSWKKFLGAGLPPELSVLQSSDNGSSREAGREEGIQGRRSFTVGEDVVQGISTASPHIMHDMAHLHCRLGHCSNKVAKEPTCASSNPVGIQNCEEVDGE
eukprot:Gb_40813 [translate_table: standard]